MTSALRWGGSLLLLGVLAWRLPWDQVGECFARLDVRLWGVAVGLYLVCQVASSLRWQLLSGPLGFRASFGRFVGMYHIGMFFNLVLPTSVGGDVVRAYYLAGVQHDAAGGRRTHAVLSVFLDRLNGLVLLVALAGFAAMFSPVVLPSWVYVAVGVAVAGLVGGVVFLFAGGVVLQTVLRRYPGLLRSKYVAVLGRLLLAAQIYRRHPGTLLAASALSLVVQALNVVLVWCIGVGLGLDVPLVCYGVVVPLTALLTLLPLSVNGIGLREAGFAVLLAPLGVAAAPAATLGLLQFLATVACSLVGLGFYLFGRYPRYRPQSSEEAGDDRTVRRDPDQGREGQPRAAA